MDPVRLPTQAACKYLTNAPVACTIYIFMTFIMSDSCTFNVPAIALALAFAIALASVVNYDPRVMLHIVVSLIPRGAIYG
jgi:hypothetical protein